MKITDLVKDPEALLATEFAIGEAQFRIEKLPAIPGWRLLERIRAEVGRTLQGLDMPEAADGKSAAMVAALSAVLALPEPFVESLRVTLFKNVQYQNRHVGQLSPLEGSEDSAFDGLEPVAVYEVLVRSLAVKFFAFLSRPVRPDLVRGSDYEPAGTERLAPFLAAPVSAGLCTYRDIRDHLTLDECAELVEILLVRKENERLAHETAKAQAEAEGEALGFAHGARAGH